MTCRIRARYDTMNGGKLLAALVCVGGLIFIALFARAWQTASADTRICKKVDRLDQALVMIVAASAVDPKPGEYGYAYFKAHPEETKGRGVGVALRELRKAACDPSNLP